MCPDVSLFQALRPRYGSVADPSSSFTGSRPIAGGFTSPAVDPALRPILDGTGGTGPPTTGPGDSPFGDISYAPTTIYTTILPPEDGGGDGSSLYIIIGLIALAGIVLFMVLK